VRPTNDYGRMISSYALSSLYAPLLKGAGSTPILFMTWGYWRDNMDQSELVDVPTFTKFLYDGYHYYANVLEQVGCKPKIAPVGLAFLVIWEENFSFWKKLFGEDKYHPSPHGTYLAACVIYATIHDHLPPSSTRFTNQVFSRSRGMQLSGDPQPLPTEEEAIYLRWIAKRVALRGYIPKSFLAVSSE